MTKRDEVELFIHCKRCYESKPKNKSIRQYSKIEVGRTKYGILVWCQRHNIEVAHLPYEWNDEMKACECDSCKEKFENG